MVSFNFSVLTLYVVLALYQFSTGYVLPSVRLVANGQTPGLEMQPGQKFHLFLSHAGSWLKSPLLATARQPLPPSFH